MIAFCGIALQYRFHKQGDTSSFGASASHCDEHQDFEKNIEEKHIFHRKKQVDSQGHWWMHQLTFRGFVVSFWSQDLANTTSQMPEIFFGSHKTET